MTDQNPRDEAAKQERIQPPISERAKSAGPIELIPPIILDELRKAGVNPTSPDVTKTLGISISMLAASGNLPLPPPAILENTIRSTQVWWRG